MDARTLTLDLSGRWYGRYGAAACPVCQPESRRQQNALTLSDGRDGRLLAHCKRSECAFREILSAAGVGLGSYTPPDLSNIARREAEAIKEGEQREKRALALWCESVSIGDTVAETYLRGRGISCQLSETLRFHHACWHPSAKRLPAIVSLVEGSDYFAVHRTYLRLDGSGKAEVDPPKAMLGAVAGGAVRLSESDGPLVVTEGIETGLSLLCGLLSGPATVWAALSTSGVRGLKLPVNPRKLIIAPDGDDPGRAAAQALATQAQALGWDVSLLPALEGRDWNDVLAADRGAK